MEVAVHHHQYEVINCADFNRTERETWHSFHLPSASAASVSLHQKCLVGLKQSTVVFMFLDLGCNGNSV